MPEQIQSMLILAGGSTSWNVFFNLEQFDEKKKKRKSKKKDKKYLNASLSSSRVINSPGI